jgi:hypothetical protein
VIAAAINGILTARKCSDLPRASSMIYSAYDA